MRTKIVAGNWKMNNTLEEGIELVDEIIRRLNPEELEEKAVLLCPPFPYLQSIAERIGKAGIGQLRLGAQNCHWEEQGTYTGEIAASMLRSVGADHVIIGHSERREHFQETNDQIARKLNTALQNGLTPVFCFGEPLSQRESGKQYQYVSQQIEESLFHLEAEQLGRLILAYEPVWAIGTGNNATPEQAQEMHGYIRNLIRQQYNEALAQRLTLLYGGSCKPENSEALFALEDVDGGLIGGASLKADDFLAIIRNL